MVKNKKVKSFRAKLAHTAFAYPGFHSMKPTTSIATAPGWDASPMPGYPQHFVKFAITVRWYTFIILGGERHCESEVSCPRTQHNDPSQSSIPDRAIQSQTR